MSADTARPRPAPATQLGSVLPSDCEQARFEDRQEWHGECSRESRPCRHGLWPRKPGAGIQGRRGERGDRQAGARDGRERGDSRSVPASSLNRSDRRTLAISSSLDSEGRAGLRREPGSHRERGGDSNLRGWAVALRIDGPFSFFLRGASRLRASSLPPPRDASRRALPRSHRSARGRCPGPRPAAPAPRVSRAARRS